jgi:hypothetical protein
VTKGNPLWGCTDHGIPCALAVVSLQNVSIVITNVGRARPITASFLGLEFCSMHARPSFATASTPNLSYTSEAPSCDQRLEWTEPAVKP